MAAVRHLHEMGICHRDLKLENFLFHSKDPSTELKLIDFGFSKRFGPDSDHIMHAVVGSPQYVAPEVFSGNYDFECDVWSLGIILHMMVTGHAPFGGADHDETIERI
jgi:calcium-dependent protein kinase